MELIKLFILFAVMMVMLMALKKPLWMGALAAIAVAAAIYGIHPYAAGKLALGAIAERNTVEILSVIYLVSFLQVMMQRKGAIVRAERAMARLFRSRRAIIIFAPIFMGLMPAPNAVVLSAPIVDSTAGDDLSIGDKTFLTSYFRHIPESALPFYPGLLLALNVTGLSAGKFLFFILPLSALSILFCYFTTVRKASGGAGQAQTKDGAGGRGRALGEMLMALWPIMALIAAVLFGGFNTAISIFAGCVVMFVIYRFPLTELWPLAKAAFHPSLIFSMALVMILKDLIASTGVIAVLPAMFSGLPLPPYLTYAVITFISGMTGLGNAIIAVLFPVAFATIPGAGIPLLILLMSFSHSAAQISPTHIGLEIAVNYFKSDFRTLILKTVPVSLFYCAAAALYYLALTSLGVH